jgi:flagellar motor switch protein FliG
MQTINLELDKNDLIVGLKGSSDELMNKFFSNMSGRAAEMMQEDMDALGAVPLAEVKEAQQKILKKIKEMDEEGKISMKILSEDELVQ